MLIVADSISFQLAISQLPISVGHIGAVRDGRGQLVRRGLLIGDVLEFAGVAGDRAGDVLTAAGAAGASGRGERWSGVVLFGDQGRAVVVVVDHLCRRKQRDMIYMVWILTLEGPTNNAALPLLLSPIKKSDF